MESKFAFNKLAFVEMDRKNILLNRRPNSMMSFSNPNQSNSSHLSHFLSATKTKGAVSKCLFGRPDEGDTQRLMGQMQLQERIRAINLYHFDIVAGQPVNLTPPASPYIGNQLPEQQPSNSERVNAPQGNDQISDDVNQNEIVIVKEEESTSLGKCESSSSPSSTCLGINNRKSLKRRSSERNEGEEEGEEFRLHSLNNGEHSR